MSLQISDSVLILLALALLNHGYVRLWFRSSGMIVDGRQTPEDRPSTIDSLPDKVEQDRHTVDGEPLIGDSVERSNAEPD